MNLPFPFHERCILSQYSTFGIGGPARYFAVATHCEALQQMLTYSYQNALPTLILGKGSNILFDDRGFDGLVILNRIDYLQQEEGNFHVGSGYSFPRLGLVASKGEWEGLEFASGIPATVGGAIYMNAGANGQETAQTLTHVVYIDEKGEKVNYRKEKLVFSYRKSSFQQWRGAIVEGVFQLKKSSLAKKKQREILTYRLKTQPYGEKSAGCAFRNPSSCAAGKLIEMCGLKGFVMGNAKISTLHANFIVNQGGAKAQDVLNLISFVKEKIYQEQRIMLEEEICYIPYDV